VDIEAVACVHNLQYRFSTGMVTNVEMWILWCSAVTPYVRPTSGVGVMLKVRG